MSTVDEFKLKYIADYIFRGDAPDYVDKSDIQVINQACVWPKGLDLSKVKYHNPDSLNRVKGWVHVNDVLVNSTGTGTLGRTAIVDSELEKPTFADGHVTVVRDSGQRFYPKFLFYTLSIQQEKITTLCAEGATNQIELSRSRFGDFLIYLPSLSIQRAIADYLDRATAKLDALIAAKQRLLDLLTEKRCALITHAVTQGLDANVPLRDSGVEWLGAIPTHWEIAAIRRVIINIEQGWSPQADEREPTEDEWGVLKLNAVKEGEFDQSKAKALPNSLDIPTSLEIHAGDFLITRANTPELVGDVCYVKQTRRKLILSDLIYRLKLDDSNIDGQFLSFFLQTFVGRVQIEADARGSSASMVKISQGHILSWFLFCPPLCEQKAIVSYIESKIAKIDDLSKATEYTINLLRERRTALIASAVTGQL